MATVPVPQTQQVRTGGLPSPALPQSAFGAGLASGLDSAGGALASVAADAQAAEDRRIKTAVMQREVEWLEFDREQRFGETGLFRKSGQAAVDARAAVEEAYGRKRDDMLAAAGTPREREVMADLLAGRFASSMDSIARFSAGEEVKAGQAAALARLGSQRAATVAIMRAGNAEEGAEALAALDSALADSVAANGLGPDEAALFAATQRSATWRDAIEGALTEGNLDLARRLYAEGEAKLTNPDDWRAVASGLRQVDLKVTAAQIAREAVTASTVRTTPRIARATPELLAALKSRESAGNPAAESPKGAAGLLQIMPGTARGLAGRFGRDFSGMSDAEVKAVLKSDTALNLAMGEAYLNDQLKAFDGNIALALAAYNAGPERAAAWAKKYGRPGEDIPLDEWLKKVPFKETREYIPAILGRAGLGGGGNEIPDRATAIATAQRLAAERFAGDPVMQEAIVGQTEAALQDAAATLANDRARAADEVDALLADPRVDAMADIPPAVLSRLDPGKALSVQNEIAGRAEAAARAGRIAAGVIDPSNEKDRAAVDQLYARQATTWAPQEATARAVDFAARAGVIPSPVRLAMVGGLRSTDPTRRLEAAGLYGRLRSANPALINGLPDDVKADANYLLDAQRKGLTPKEAADQLAFMEKLGPEELKARAAAFRKGLGPRQQTAVAGLGRMIARDNSVADAKGWGGDFAVPPEMLADFVTVAQNNYLRMGDAEAAMSAAYDQIRRVWSPSAFNGGRGFMRNAPEALYGVEGMTVGQNAKWMTEQARGDAGVAGDVRVVEAPGLRGRDGRPVYFLMTEKDGRLAYVQGAGGRSVVWRPDWATSPEYRRREEAEKRRIAEARRRARADREALDAARDADAATSAADPLVNMQGGA